MEEDNEAYDGVDYHIREDDEQSNLFYQMRYLATKNNASVYI